MRDSDAMAEPSQPIVLLRLPIELFDKILYSFAAPDITNLACVSGPLRASLRQHPVVLALAQLGAPRFYAGLIGGMEAIQSTPLPFRESLMREYASRMVRIDDGDGAIPWLYYLRLCERQLHAGPPEEDRFLGMRDLCIVQPLAMLRLLKRPLQQSYLAYSWQQQLQALPEEYRTDLSKAIIGLNSGETKYDRAIWGLIDNADDGSNPPPLRRIAVMAALQLFDVHARDVCHRFVKRFGLTSEQRTTQLEPMVVEAVATCFSLSVSDLAAVMQRWSMNHTTFLPALHAALLTKAVDALRGPWAELYGASVTPATPLVQMQAVEQVLGIPANAARDIKAIQSVMPTFWTLFWMSDRIVMTHSNNLPWQTVLHLPWQVQPTLLARLASQAGLALTDVDGNWGDSRSLEHWEQQIVETCMTHDRPRLAVRALMLACHLSRFRSHDKRSVILLRALTLAVATMPPWSWNELIEALCLHRVEAQRIPRPSWPRDVDVEHWLTTFLADPASYLIAPSPMLVAALIRHAESIWRHAPNGEGSDGERFDRLCERLDLSQRDRGCLSDSLTCFSEIGS
ncbi:hypothetical protein [Robbsia sp. KACC 23696]|uniref:hypothetical protein n=1 Tax=Robbsia sp. KACC 23696 TaxID=3149231 RepID=UPI00325BC2E7